MKSLLIIKPSALGDVIQSTCLLPLIKQKNPDIKISWLIFEHNKEIVTDHPLIDNVFIFNRKNNFLKELFKLRKQLKKTKFDIVVDIQGLLRSALFSLFSKSKRRVGYKNAREGAHFFYTEKYYISTKQHAVKRYLKLFEMAGIISIPEEIDFPLPIKDIHTEKINKMLLKYDSKNIITICPTSRWITKCWPKNYFISLINMLEKKLNAKIILLGSLLEKDIINYIENATSNSLNLAGKLNLMEISALLKKSHLFIGSDSALMHMASGTKTPSIAIFGPTDPKKTAPFNPFAKILKMDLDCMPCFKKHCKNIKCMNLLKPETIFNECLKILNKKTS